MAAEWWRSGVLYEIYPRSFADSNGDGHGDLQGILDHLDHCEWLGIDGIWLSPVTPSPDADWGYDVSDYTSIHPDFGDLETFDRLVTEARRGGIRVILDLVPNHTSDQHPWFLDARSSRGARYRDWYVWADPKPDGGPPNNWRSVFGGPAWTLDETTGQYYLHNFLAEQPDLNWWNEEVRDAFDDILRFWLDRGAAGFRIDVANGLVKDRDLRDTPPVTDEDHPLIRQQGLRPVHNMNRPEVHEVFKRWRTLVDAYRPDRVLLGETWVLDLGQLIRFYGRGTDQLHLAMNFPFVFADFGPALRSVVEAADAGLPPRAWSAWHGSSHDAGRFPTRWCDGDPPVARGPGAGPLPHPDAVDALRRIHSSRSGAVAPGRRSRHQRGRSTRGPRFGAPPLPRPPGAPAGPAGPCPRRVRPDRGPGGRVGLEARGLDRGRRQRV